LLEQFLVGRAYVALFGVGVIEDAGSLQEVLDVSFWEVEGDD
jgi:hypothetical protein